MTDNQPLINTSLSDSPMDQKSNGLRTFGIVVITILLTLGLGYWAFTAYLFPTSFNPVELSKTEQIQLDKKLASIRGVATSKDQKTLKPEAYNDKGANREIYFTEKELNSILANNTDLASKLAIDLSDNLASAKLLVTLDPDFPVLGGKTLKVSAGVELLLRKGKPRVSLKGVSVWGVPIPNAWLGNMKNIDLFEEFGESGGFWELLNDGLESIEVKEGKLQINLKE